MPGRLTTLSDVAALAGVDSSTASRVLNDSSTQRVSAETRERILNAAQSLGYRPNALARSLRTARTGTLGIVVPLLDSPVFTQIVEGAEQAALALGYSLVISHIEEQGAAAETYERLASNNQVDGLLVSTLDENSVTVQSVMRARVPFVIVNRKVPGVAHCVSFDMRAATLLAMEHLFQLGHRRIAHLSADPGTSTGTRFLGYQEALASAGLAYDPGLVAISNYTIDGGRAAMRAILERPGARPTAVFPLTLSAAVGAMLELRRCGLRVPQDMSVVSIHDGALAEVMDPSITTVSLPTRELGDRGARALVEVIGGKRKRTALVLPPKELLVRGSTGPVPPTA